jgi:hypothetical protein
LSGAFGAFNSPESIMWFIAAIIGLGALWDAFTTFFGIVQVFNILGGEVVNPAQIIFAIVVSLVILGFLISTHVIWSFETDDVVTLILKGAWLVCLVLDTYTAYIGNKFFVFNNNLETASHHLGLIIVTLLITISSLLLSRIVMARELRRRGYLY